MQSKPFDPKPERIYILDLHNPDGRAMRQYTGRRGVRYTTLQQARARQETLWKKHQIISTIYVSELSWVEIPDSDEIYN